MDPLNNLQVRKNNSNNNRTVFASARDHNCPLVVAVVPLVTFCGRLLFPWCVCCVVRHYVVRKIVVSDPQSPCVCVTM